MSDPVKTAYGNVMEKAVIEEWITKQGHICPLTGAPLSEMDLKPDTELKTKIRKWILQRSMDGSAQENPEEDKITGKISPKKNKIPKDDDLYDF